MHCVVPMGLEDAVIETDAKRRKRIEEASNEAKAIGRRLDAALALHPMTPKRIKRLAERINRLDKLCHKLGY